MSRTYVSLYKNKCVHSLPAAIPRSNGHCRCSDLRPPTHGRKFRPTLTKPHCASGIQFPFASFRPRITRIKFHKHLCDIDYSVACIPAMSVKIGGMRKSIVKPLFCRHERMHSMTLIRTYGRHCVARRISPNCNS